MVVSSNATKPLAAKGGQPVCIRVQDEFWQWYYRSQRTALLKRHLESAICAQMLRNRVDGTHS